MALDKEFFESVNIDVVKKKYYNANKVNTLLGSIQEQAETMTQENELLRKQLQALNGQKTEIGDALLSAQALAKKIVAQAHEQADSIVRQAQTKADSIVSDARERRNELLSSVPDQQEYAARCVEAVINRLRQQHLDAIDTLNDEWQNFLCGLMPDDAAATKSNFAQEAAPAAGTVQDAGNPADDAEGAEEYAEGDNVHTLEEKVNAIARELQKILDK